jgi:cyclopropane-fatty-acyl-phospholipid synthase
MSSEQLLTPPSKSKASLSDRLMPKAWARSMILKHLGTMQRGQLVIKENGEKTVYGDQSDNVGLVAELTIVNIDTYSALALNGVIGAGESYMEGHWTSPDLVKVIRFFVVNMQTLDAMDGERTWLSRMGMWLLDRVNRNTIARAQKNISAHYDLGNDFFSLFLDQTMMYSSAVFADETISLYDASNAKLETICQQLKLNADDHLVEIGTGWGGMAIYAAQHYGCRVTTTTISQEQFDFATQRVNDLGLNDQVTVLMQDYRKLTGRYDKLVSIEMIEAVGRQYFSEYFSRCADLLKPDGLMLIQAITIADQRYDQATKAVDFIQRYIFPGGCLPSVNIIGHHVASNTDMMIISLSDIGRDYAITLERWREQFLEKLETVRSQGFDERFIRMWEYYLCYCEGGFRERVISTAQIVMAKPDYRAVSSNL